MKRTTPFLLLGALLLVLGGSSGKPLPTGSGADRSAPASAPWDPLAMQQVEPDTLYLLDAEAEERLKAGDGGLIEPNGAEGGWQKVAKVSGKYRSGLRSLVRGNGFLWMPLIGLLPADEFTIELWLQCDRPWATVSDNTPLFLGDEHGSAQLRFLVHNGYLRLRLNHLQDPSGPVQAEIAHDLARHPLPAETWVNVAATFREQTLRLYVNGRFAGEKANVRPPHLWSDAGRYDGLSLAGGLGRGATEFALSDLRISRRARVPGEPVRHLANDTVTITRTPNGSRVRQSLLGGLHRLRGPETEHMARGALQVLRTDKLLVATPIKPGEPDLAHPSAGVSGRYSYDWQVVDRSFEYYQRLGITPYISIDATPQILGGSVPPYSGQRLLSAYAWSSEFPRQVPTDWDAFGAMVRDLVHHVVRERHFPVTHWGVWNEPNSTIFWNNSLTDYLKLYEVCARAVKSVDGRLQVGGPETADWNPQWVESLIRTCAQQALPLDFISWHYYLSTIAEIPRAQAQVSYWARKHGLKRMPELIVGEWCWQAHNFPGNGYYPWRTRNYYLNDWHAAFTAASLMEMQRAGVLYSIYTNTVAEAGKSGFQASGLMAPTHPWANLNVFRLWSRLGPDLVSVTGQAPPGVFVQASRGAAESRGRAATANRQPAASGRRLTILLAHLRYRKDRNVRLTLKLPQLTADARITQHVIDDRHSNRYDAGPSHTELETIPPIRTSADTLQVDLAPRSVHLIEIE